MAGAQSAIEIEDDPTISIGVLAEPVGLAGSAVRRYENAGLLIAHRTKSGRRVFSHEDVRRASAIQHLAAAPDRS